MVFHFRLKIIGKRYFATCWFSWRLFKYNPEINFRLSMAVSKFIYLFFDRPVHNLFQISAEMKSATDHRRLLRQ